jgi:hypothetical protein
VGRAAAEAPTFPESLTPRAVIAWLQGESDLPPSAVVAISSTAVTGILAVTSADPFRRHVDLHSESLSAAAYEEDGALSWRTRVEVDCKTRKAMLGPSMSYPQRNLRGEGRARPAGNTSWVSPVANGAAYNAMLRVCDGKAGNPLRAIAGGRLAAPAEAALRSSPAGTGASPSADEAARATGPTSPTASAAISGSRRASVQVSAASTPAQASRELTRMQGLGVVPAAISPRVERAVVGRTIYYRALFGDFDGPEEAAAFCRSLVLKGVKCLVRYR